MGGFESPRVIASFLRVASFELCGIEKLPESVLFYFQRVKVTLLVALRILLKKYRKDQGRLAVPVNLDNGE